MKISQWLEESIGSHDICDAVMLAKDFAEKTGCETASWPVHSERETIDAIERRGLGGSLKEMKPRATVVWGYELAAHLARKHAGHSSTMMGRGFLFRDCIAALKKADK